MGTQSLTALLDERPGPFGNPLSKRQGAEASLSGAICGALRTDCALHKQDAPLARLFTTSRRARLLHCSNFDKPGSAIEV
jgi:hypothetical protein